MQDSSLSDSDAEDEGSECGAQQQLASPAARAALTAYSISLHSRPGQGSGSSTTAACSTGQPDDEASPCSTSSSCLQAQGVQGKSLGSKQQSQGPGKAKGHRRKKKWVGRAAQEGPSNEQQPLQSRPSLSLARDPAKDIARAAARSSAGSSSVTRGLSLVPLIRPSPGSGTYGVSSGSFNVSSFSVQGASATAAQSPMLQRQMSALEPVEFAIDRPLWKRASSSQSRRLQSFVSLDSGIREQPQTAKTELRPASPSLPSVVTPILTTAQLDPDAMEGDRAIPDYPWHYNFIPAARRAPTGTAGFAATASSLEQDRRRLLLIESQQRQTGMPVATLAREAEQEECLPAAAACAPNQSRLMGYSRSLSSTAGRPGLPDLEINGHPVSLRLERPSSARVTIN